MSKTYTVDIQLIDGDRLYEVHVEVLDEEQRVILTGHTHVSADSQEEVEHYVEYVYMPDLRVNYHRLIGDLRLSWEPEPVEPPEWPEEEEWPDEPEAPEEPQEPEEPDDEELDDPDEPIDPELDSDPEEGEGDANDDPQAGS